MIIMRMCGAERRPEIQHKRPSEHRPSRSFPSVARCCVRCSDAPCDDRPAQPGVLQPERVEPGHSRAAQSASGCQPCLGQLVAANRRRSSRRPSWELQHLPRTTSLFSGLLDKMMEPATVGLLNANRLQASSVIFYHRADSHSPPRDANLIVRYTGGLWKKRQTTPVRAPTSA